MSAANAAKNRWARRLAAAKQNRNRDRQSECAAEQRGARRRSTRWQPTPEAESGGADPTEAARETRRIQATLVPRRARCCPSWVAGLGVAIFGGIVALVIPGIGRGAARVVGTSPGVGVGPLGHPGSRSTVAVPPHTRQVWRTPPVGSAPSAAPASPSSSPVGSPLSTMQPKGHGSGRKRAKHKQMRSQQQQRATLSALRSAGLPPLSCDLSLCHKL